MIKIDVPGCYNITNNKVLAVILFCTFFTFLINTSIYFLDDKNIDYNNYDLYDCYDFHITNIISIFIVMTFLVSDIYITNSFWDDIGERALTVDESEEPYNDNFIVRPFNSHSSIFLFYGGLYTLVHYDYTNKYYYACYLFSISQMFMGIVSYLWWASNLNNIHMIDNLCMELIVNSISVLVWTTIFPEYELFFIGLSLLYLLFHYIYFSNARLFELSIIFVGGSLLTTYYNGNGDYISFSIGSIFSIGGLIPKILDRVNRFQLGTSLFHFMEAFGFVMFYKWIQTI